MHQAKQVVSKQNAEKIKALNIKIQEQRNQIEELEKAFEDAHQANVGL